MDYKNMFHGRMEDLAEKAIKTGWAASRFLTPTETAAVAAQFARRRDAVLSFDGGVDGAERMRAIFLNPDWGAYRRDDLFTGLQISHRPQDTLGHRDILGALMALGIQRDTVGDIWADTLPNALVCLPEIREFIMESLTKAGRIGIRVLPISLYELPTKKETLIEKSDTVASLRLDAVLCAAFDMSRSKAAQLIALGLVALNHEVCLQPAKEVSENTTLSVRGIGRVKVTEVGGTSRKGRIFIKMGLYSR